MGAFFVRGVNFTDFCLKSTILHHFLHFEKGFSYSFPSLLSTFSLPLFLPAFYPPKTCLLIFEIKIVPLHGNSELT